MIASENYSSLATQCAMGNLLTDKYAEGIPHHRFYAGCDNVDSIEDLANQRARELFGAAHAYAQPHSGADANLVAFWAILRARVELPAMARAPGRRGPGRTRPRRLVQADTRPVERRSARRWAISGCWAWIWPRAGHLTHGYRLNSSGKMFESHGYTVDRETFLLDYDAIERQAIEVKPLILLAGFSAYSRNINYARMREIADKVGAVLMVDMAHFAGSGRRQGAPGRVQPDRLCPRRRQRRLTRPCAGRGAGWCSAPTSSRNTSTAAARWCWEVRCPT